MPLLARMERTPNAVFANTEIAKLLGEEQARALRRDRVLVPVQTSPEGLTQHGTSLALRRDRQGRIEAFDDENPEQDPVSVRPDDLRRWRIDLTPWAAQLRRRNGLSGSYREIPSGGRLHLVGYRADATGRTTYVLALLADSLPVAAILAGLPPLLSPRPARLVVLCPTFAVPLEISRSLDALSVYPVQMDEDDPFWLPSFNSVAVAGYVFRREGDFWTMAFEHERHRIRHLVGLAQISELLQHPFVEISVLDLAARASVGVTVPTELKQVLRSAGEQIDAEAQVAYRKEISSLDLEIGASESHGDRQEVKRLRDERDLLAQHLSGAVGLRGRRRAAADPVDRARQSVSKNIKHAISALAENTPLLAHHLDTCIETGSRPSYRPEKPIDWRT